MALQCALCQAGLCAGCGGRTWHFAVNSKRGLRPLGTAETYNRRGSARASHEW
ncbi:MAG: hypothetical protein AAF639_35050 [Chloroflexota bacterium]